jgi:hypothetical protein
LIISIFSEIIQGDECANIAKRRKFDNEHENISINVDTVGKRSINNVSKDRKTDKKKRRKEKISVKGWIMTMPYSGIRKIKQIRKITKINVWKRSKKIRRKLYH